MTKGRDLVLDWDTRLGWDKNPFKNRIPENPEEFIAGLFNERKKLNLFVIKKHGFGIIKGEQGSGKTMVLRWLSHELKKYPDKLSVRYIQIPKAISDQELVDLIVRRTESFMDKAVGFYSKLRKMDVYITANNFQTYMTDKLAKKRMIILIDDAYKLSKSNTKLLNDVYKNIANLHIIMAGTPSEMNNTQFKNNRDFLKLTLKGLTPEEATRMIGKRIEHAGGHKIYPYTPEEINTIVKKAGGNPRKILAQCQEEAIKISLDSERVQYMHEEINREKEALHIETKTGSKSTSKTSGKKSGVRFKIGGITIKSAEETKEPIAEIQEEVTVKDSPKKPKKIDKATEEQLRQLMDDYDDAQTEAVHAEEMTINNETHEIEIDTPETEEVKPKKKKESAEEEKENADLIEQLAKELGD